MIAGFPSAAKADLFPGYISGIQIQNLDPADASASLVFYKADGSVRETVAATIPGGASKTYVTLPLTSTDPFTGSLVISSDKPLAVYANISSNNSSARGSYVGASQGSTSVSIPLLMKNNGASSQYTTWFSVQNVGTGTATVSTTYTDGCGKIADVSIPAGASVKFDQGTETCHTVPVFGATVTSTNQLVVVVLQESAVRSAISAWTGFHTAGNADIKVPLVNVQPATPWATGIQIFNTGAASTNLTLTYLDQDGVKTCKETQTLAAGATSTFALQAFATGASATITTDCKGLKLVGTAFLAAPADNSGGVTLLAVVNQTKYTSTTNFTGAYTAFNSADATNAVMFPLIEDRNGSRKWNTGFNIMNVGTAQTFVKCTFTGNLPSTYVPQKAILPNQAMNDLQGTHIAAGFVGSGTCKAYTDANYTTVDPAAKIVGVLNQTATPLTAAEKDLLMVDEGINITQ